MVSCCSGMEENEEGLPAPPPAPLQLYGEVFPVQEGDLLSSPTCKYVAQTFLGEGAFGKIAKCLKLNTTEAVAIKILHSKTRIKDAEEEVAMLEKLCHLDPDRDNFVRWHDYFLHKDHPCLVFEVMDINLCEFMEQRRGKPLPLRDIRPITQHPAVALKAFERIGLMHCDLKPENIMLVDCVQKPLKVKIIDFGLATPTAEAKCGSVVQTRWWRAPEILLGLPFTEAIDMWSLGCVMVELFQGEPLYPADTEYNMIRYIMKTHGEIPHCLVDAGVKTHQFFSRNSNILGLHSWRLKTPLEYRIRSGISPKERIDNWILSSLDDLVKLCPRWRQEQLEDTRMFVGLVKRMLTLDAAGQITPSEALQHPFTTMSHLLEHYPHSSYTLIDSSPPLGPTLGHGREPLVQAEAVPMQLPLEQEKKPAGPIGSSVKCHLSVKSQKERKKSGRFSRFFQTRVNKVVPAGPECSIVLPSKPEGERESHGCLSWLLCPIRCGKQRLTQWLEKQRGFHCRPAQNNS